MNPLPQLIPSISDVMTVRRVFGEPYERDGVTIIPAAAVRGGGGSGSGKEEGRTAEGRPEGGRQEGEGGGFGITARPAGAYVYKDGTVTWQPAVDVEPDRRGVRRGVGGDHLADQPDPAGQPEAPVGEPEDGPAAPEDVTATGPPRRNGDQRSSTVRGTRCGSTRPPPTAGGQPVAVSEPPEPSARSRMPADASSATRR